MKWVESEAKITVVPKSEHGVPTYFNHESDFGVHLDEGYMSDGQFVAANLKTHDGRELGIMLHMMCVNPRKDKGVFPGMLSIISMTDFTENTYCVKEDVFMQPTISYAADKLDIKTPISYMRREGDMFYAGTDLPDGKGRIELEMERTGPFLFNCATGAFPFLNDEVIAYQFSVPSLKATGKLTLNGKEYKVEGDAWIDRQWGDGNEDFGKRTFKWKWMNLNLSNGYKISVWDVVVNDKKENCWATVMSPKGAHTVVDVVPFSKGEGNIYESPVTGQKYPSTYVIEMPSLDAKFDVKVRGLLEQEIASATGEDKYEAACTFTGTFMGEKVEGFNYVELVGSFK
ncbi:MAG: hypothetical protein EOM51_06350 [Clostridia bacterium]|nr:hypothetical protein [Clostridia bacterium]